MMLKRILLAEDSQQDVELTLEALREYKLANRVDVVKDGVEVVEFLRCEGKYAQRKRGNPVVVLLDIKMPRMDGIEALRIIRDDPAFKALPVVMLTSSREEPDMKKAYALGANAYVVKPVEFKEFVKALKIVGLFWAVINELPEEVSYNGK